jgi:hypothetical protein
VASSGNTGSQERAIQCGSGCNTKFSSSIPSRPDTWGNSRGCGGTAERIKTQPQGAFNAYLKDCCEKVKVATNRFHEWKRVEYESGAEGFYDTPNFNWPSILRETRTPTWFPVTGTVKRPAEIPAHLESAARTAERPPVGNAPVVASRPIAKIRVFVVNPDDFGGTIEPDDYELFTPEVAQILITITSYSVHEIWTAIRAQLTRGEYPRVLYAWARLPTDPIQVVENPGDAVPRREERKINLKGMTYKLDFSTTTQITTDGREVQTWIRTTSGPIRGMICILRRADGANTPPRDQNLHFNRKGTLLPWTTQTKEAPLRPPRSSPGPSPAEVPDGISSGVTFS